MLGVYTTVQCCVLYTQQVYTRFTARRSQSAEISLIGDIMDSVSAISHDIR